MALPGDCGSEIDIGRLWSTGSVHASRRSSTRSPEPRPAKLSNRHQCTHRNTRGAALLRSDVSENRVQRTRARPNKIGGLGTNHHPPPGGDRWIGPPPRPTPTGRRDGLDHPTGRIPPPGIVREGLAASGRRVGGCSRPNPRPSPLQRLLADRRRRAPQGIQTRLAHSSIQVTMDR